MASRYVSTKVLNKCLSPITVYHDGDKFVVPCGRCDACLLQKANDWSQRVGAEIENNHYSIFFTLTYDNFYVPKLRPYPTNVDGVFEYRSNHPDNVRYDGKKDVLRTDDISFLYNLKRYPLQHYAVGTDVSYCSKRDVQLWLKLLRKDLYEKFGKYNLFRYYVISEYGPTTFRSHLHGIIFCDEFSVSEALLRESLYSNWKMCDKALFDEHTHYCDSGCRGYVTEYITGVNRLPVLFREKQIRPFRLASKAPAIGFSIFDKDEISEKISQSSIEYSRRIERVEQNFILHYPARFVRSLFPKCYRFRLLPFNRLLQVYGKLYRLVIEKRFHYEVVSNFLRSRLRIADWSATLKCFNFCMRYGCHPFHYCYLVDNYYYLESMVALKSFYEWQETHCDDTLDIIRSYSNFGEYVLSYRQLHPVRSVTFEYFCSNFSIDAYDLSLSFKTTDLISHNDVDDLYRLEVEDIISSSQKMAKFNELFGGSPHIV